jgi:hypothetical protein
VRTYEADKKIQKAGNTKQDNMVMIEEELETPKTP